MKAATGELNLTVITLVAIGLVIAFFTAFLYPRIKTSISTVWDNINHSGDDCDPETLEGCSGGHGAGVEP